jgi:hypothetical protein
MHQASPFRAALISLAFGLALTPFARAADVVGFQFTQTLGYSSTNLNATALDIHLETFALKNWVVESLDASDIGTTFIASEATIGNYNRLDWAGIKKNLFGGGRPLDNILFGMGAAGKGWGSGVNLLTRELYAPPVWLDLYITSDFTPPEIYFKSLNRIELEIVDISFPPNGVRGTWIWRFYGEPTSVPEPASALLCALGLITIVACRRRR